MAAQTVFNFISLHAIFYYYVVILKFANNIYENLYDFEVLPLLAGARPFYGEIIAPSENILN